MFKWNCDLSLFKNATVVIPTISVANVAQLTVDLLITNTSAKRVGSVWSRAFIPYVGMDSFDDSLDSQTKDLSCMIELYQTASDILIFQIRSPYANKFDIKACVRELVDTLKGLEVKRLLVLTAVYDHCRLPLELDDKSSAAEFRYIESPEFHNQHHQEIEHLPLKQYLQGSRLSEATSSNPYCLKHCGTGFAHDLLSACVERQLPAVVFLSFTSDGFNNMLAVKFFRLISTWLPLSIGERVLFPHSWKFLTGQPDRLMNRDFNRHFDVGDDLQFLKC
ncbi:hypothetical protein LSTR_LSTR002327 [Laodelphax striatellus]|uniref:Proteasome assembly chaperone 2 n=1 Tax=Laodelphax striatellus TaxID=195883 RepID=A0A482X244_LAOST|nr:hypothetical protein LSTR_LSTR002327 [Laodelphax striatellus]